MTTPADGSRPEPDDQGAGAWGPPPGQPAGQDAPGGWGPPPAPPTPGTGQPGQSYGQHGPGPGYPPPGQPQAPAYGQSYAPGPPAPGQPPVAQPGPAYGQESYGQTYGQPPTGQPAYGQTYGQPGQPGYGPGPATGFPSPQGYRPPAARPGIIPLRPLGLGELLDGAFRAIRHNPRVMFGLTAIVVGVSVVIETLVLLFGMSGFVNRMLALDPDVLVDDAEIAAELGSAALSTLGLVLVTVIVSGAITWVLVGLLTISVSRSVLGDVISVGEVWQRSAGQRLKLLGLVVVMLFLVGVVPALWVTAFIAAVVAEAAGLAALVGLLGLPVVIVWSVWLSVRTLLAPPVLVLERTGVIAAIRRGWQLSRGSFWRLFGISLLAAVIAYAAMALIGVPFQILGTVVAGAMEAQGVTATLTAITLITALGQLLASTVITPFLAAVGALLYIDVRMRREGLDVELARAADPTTA